MIYIEIFLSSAYLFIEIVTLLYTVSQKTSHLRLAMTLTYIKLNRFW